MTLTAPRLHGLGFFFLSQRLGYVLKFMGVGLGRPGAEAIREVTVSCSLQAGRVCGGVQAGYPIPSCFKNG